MNIEFTDSELLLIETIIKIDMEKLFPPNCDFIMLNGEMLLIDKPLRDEYVVILDKLKYWREQEHNRIAAYKVLCGSVVSQSIKQA